jgi:hypothetical protein
LVDQAMDKSPKGRPPDPEAHQLVLPRRQAFLVRRGTAEKVIRRNAALGQGSHQQEMCQIPRTSQCAGRLLMDARLVEIEFLASDEAVQDRHGFFPQ